MDISATLEAGITALVAASVGLYDGTEATNKLRGLEAEAGAATGLKPSQIRGAAQAIGGGNSQVIHDQYAPSIDSQLGKVADCTIANTLVQLLDHCVQADHKTAQVKAHAEQASNALEQVNNEAEVKFGQVVHQAAAVIGDICRMLGGVNRMQAPEVFAKVVHLGGQAIDCALDALSGICHERNDAIRGIGEHLVGLVQQATAEVQDLLAPQKTAVLGGAALAAVAVAGGLFHFADCIEPLNEPPAEPPPNEPPKQEQPEKHPPPKTEPVAETQPEQKKGIDKTEAYKVQQPVAHTPKNEPVVVQTPPKNEPVAPVTPAQSESAPTAAAKPTPAMAVPNEGIKPRKAGSW